MTPEQKAAYVVSQSACALIEAMGMHAENQKSVAAGGMPPFGKDDFDALIVKNGIYHNAVHEYTHQ